MEAMWQDTASKQKQTPGHVAKIEARIEAKSRNGCWANCKAKTVR